MNSYYSSFAGATVRWFDFHGHGDPVIFIHGLGCASSYDYPRVVTEPAFLGLRAVLLDLPGFGYSDKPEAFGYGTGEQARVVVELLDRLQLTHCSLFGHSMGGSIAIEAAELLGHRVEALLVSEPNFYAGGGMYSRAIVAQAETGFVAQGFADLLAAETSPWAGCLQNSSPRAVWRGARSLVDGVSPSWFARFQQLSCRKALIYGELSLPAQEADDAVAAGIPLLMVPEAGHSMAWENPVALADCMAQFFAPAQANV